MLHSFSPPINLPPYEAVVEKAKSLGFSQVGLLALPTNLDEPGEKLETWLSKGFHGEMQWMVTHLEKRLNPLTLMPEAKSLFCVTLNYYNGNVTEQSIKIARYARGDDYHDVVKAKLKLLLQWLQEQDSRIIGRPLTDSAPILEKALAVKAGLGWQGKHTNLITREQGSWVFLGELLLNVVFPDGPAEQPVADLCGRCRRCIEACPTQAIVEPNVLDATKCIAYWTIEFKGEQFPEEIKQNLNGWLFGCDICQEVCPWNIKFQQPTQEAAFIPRPWNHTLRADDIKQLTEAQFKVRYRKSPLKRVKLSGLKRNLRQLQINTNH